VNNNPRAIRALGWVDGQWRELIPITEVKAFAANLKEYSLSSALRTKRLKFEIFPDGGINRIRVYGRQF
jgi:allantoicase